MFSLVPAGAFATAEPVAKGSIGISFGERDSVICGETLEGRVYSYDIEGTDAFHLSFSYDQTAFSKVTVEAVPGVTILACEQVENLVNVVFMASGDADYSNLLKVAATAGADEAAGGIGIASAVAAKKGGTVALTIIDGKAVEIISDSLIDEFTIETLSAAMTFFMVDKTSPNWPRAAKYDLNKDGVIDIADFTKIANAILDAQRISQLKFGQNGKFKIMQMTDIQDYVGLLKPNMNASTRNLMNAALDAEKPDLVVITGDQLGGNMNADQLQAYITQIAAPMEARGIPWMVTYGNHDEDATTALNSGWNKIQQLAFYRSFKYNVNRASMSGAQGFDRNGRNTHAVGDMYQLIYDNTGKNPLFNVWALDSNRYDDSGKGIGGYDWIRPGQIQWYSNTSKLLEAKYGKKIPSLMFYHIPTLEWEAMWAQKDKYGVTGERNEGECPANVNSGLFTAVLERGDVLGMFVGHEHVNDYVGDYHGVKLGYSANTGYQTYGLGGTTANNHRMRGVRILELDQGSLDKFETRMVFASDLGL
ncbi:MAG: metallophosphoesterase family protein [Coriobacteriia bacterium]|nr:metallophosphoesterase family protein [Coriobacteriia bacterium]